MWEWYKKYRNKAVHLYIALCYNVAAMEPTCNLATSGIHWHSNWERVKTGEQQFPSLRMLVLGVEQYIETICPCI